MRINNLFSKLLKTLVIAVLYITTWAMKDYWLPNLRVNDFNLIVNYKLKSKNWGYFSKATVQASSRAFCLMNQDNAYSTFWHECFTEYYEVTKNKRNIKQYTIK